MKLQLFPTLVFALFGLLGGLGAFTFDYAEGLSYLSEDPAVCANCHIMLPQYDSWHKSSHHNVATCADCHLPAEFPDKYIAKSQNGWSHSKAFTLQDFSEPIFIKQKNADILQRNCLRCHEKIVDNQFMPITEDAPRCVRCHVSVGHGEPAGLGGPMGPGEAQLRRTNDQP